MRTIVVAALALVSIALAPPPSPAAGFLVDTTVDAMDAAPGNGVCASGAGACTLRAAIEEGNALAGPDSVTLPASLYRLTLGRLTITDALSIAGADEATTIVRGGGGSSVSGLTIAPGVPVAISNCTLTRHFSGRGDFDGGAIFNQGSLTLANVTLSKNRTDKNGGAVANSASGDLTLIDVTLFKNKALHGGGGGIANGGALTITDSSVERNRALDGGGLNNDGPVTMTNVTFARNHAGYGGGITNLNTITLINSTLKRNRAKQDGGGLMNRPPLGGEAHFVNCTLADNLAQRGSAVGRYPQVGDVNATLHNTIVVGRNSCSSPVISLGHNLDGGTTCGLAGPGDQSAVDPLLGRLDDNGGPTQTLALPPDSPAVDAGDDAGCPAHDQRGVPRPQGAACDVGAYELEP